MHLPRWLALLVLLLVVTAPAGTPAAADQPAAPAPAGRILFVKDGDLWVWEAALGAHPLATGGTFAQPSWAPDGASLAYVYRGTNFSDIFVTDDQGQAQTRLTNSQSTILDNDDWNLRPTWSPDGKLIAFVSDHSSALPTLWLMNADGSGRRTLSTPGLNSEAVDSMAWSPDGAQLAVTLFNEPGPTQVALIPLGSAGRQAGRILTDLPGGALDPAWAPDGSWLAFAGRDGYAIDVYAERPDGSGTQKLTSDGLLARSPAWSPDGRHIAYLLNRGGYFEIWMVDVQADESGALAVSTPRQLTQDLHVDATSGLSWGQ
jgi:TolB protein